MGQILSSPQNIIKAIVEGMIGFLETMTNFMLSLIQKITKNQTNIPMLDSMFVYINIHIKYIMLHILQTKTAISNIINKITNYDQLFEYHSVVSVTTDLPADDAEETEINSILCNEANGVKHICVLPRYDCIYNVELIANYYSWLKENCSLNRKSTQVLSYKFSLPDQFSVDSLEDLVVIPQLLNFEDRTPPIINGTTVPSPLSEVSLHLIYVFTKPTSCSALTEVIYDPEVDITFPQGVTALKSIWFKSSLIFDRSVLSSTKVVDEKLKFRANIKVQCNKILDNVTKTKVISSPCS